MSRHAQTLFVPTVKVRSLSFSSRWRGADTSVRCFDVEEVRVKGKFVQLLIIEFREAVVPMPSDENRTTGVRFKPPSVPGLNLNWPH